VYLKSSERELEKGNGLGKDWVRDWNRDWRIWFPLKRLEVCFWELWEEYEAATEFVLGTDGLCI
jgi:hypothetical protein